MRKKEMEKRLVLALEQLEKSKMEAEVKKKSLDAEMARLQAENFRLRHAKQESEAEVSIIRFFLMPLLECFSDISRLETRGPNFSKN
jgi:hypothetical protein